jgi:hypothetical protein
MSWIRHPLAGAFLIVGGIALLGFGAWRGVENDRLLRAAETVPGKVVALERRKGTRGSTREHAVVEYRDPRTGTVETFTSAFGIWPSPFAVGDDVAVAVRRDPPRIEIDSFWSLFFMPLVVAVFGLACLLAGRSILNVWRSR